LTAQPAPYSSLSALTDGKTYRKKLTDFLTIDDSFLKSRKSRRLFAAARATPARIVQHKARRASARRTR
jgi:hypothetical protein